MHWTFQEHTAQEKVGRYLEAILQCRVALSPPKELFLPPTNSLGRLFGEPKFLPPLQINFFAESQGGSGLSMTALILPTTNLTTNLFNEHKKQGRYLMKKVQT